MAGHDASFAANEALWNAWTKVHATGDFYDLQGFRTDLVRIRPYEIEMIGDVAGKSLLHLQCRSCSRSWRPNRPRRRADALGAGRERSEPE